MSTNPRTSKRSKLLDPRCTIQEFVPRTVSNQTKIESAIRRAGSRKKERDRKRGWTYVGEDLDAKTFPAHVEVSYGRDPVSLLLSSSRFDEATVLGTEKRSESKRRVQRSSRQRGRGSERRRRTHTIPNLGTAALTPSRSEIPRPESK